MIFPPLTWVLLLVAAAICAIGFYKFVYFMSVGYGLAVSGIGVTIFIIALLRGNLTPAMAVLCLLLLIYGIRLGGFLLIREIKSAAYRKTLNEQTGNPVPFPVKVVMWLLMAVLYVVQTSPVWYRESAAPNGPLITAWIGAAIMAIGILLEAVADRQKSAAKLKAPNKPAMDGLYKISRCPNYFGEVTFWTGVFISGWGVLVAHCSAWVCDDPHDHDQRGPASRKTPEQELRKPAGISGLCGKDTDFGAVHSDISSCKAGKVKKPAYICQTAKI